MIINNDSIKLDNKSEQILECIKKNKYVTTNEISNLLSIPLKTTSRKIKVLKDNGMIKKVGSNKTGHWEIV